jgi:hypothetical protein
MAADSKWEVCEREIEKYKKHYVIDLADVFWVDSEGQRI